MFLNLTLNFLLKSLLLKAILVFSVKTFKIGVIVEKSLYKSLETKQKT
ncbi:hypothetical protein FH5_02469 [Priestia endophytica]|nr:hypothetical protein FH5_02469 [Priestia endophytica]